MANRYDPDLHHRRSLRLKGYDYSQAGAYFVTICTQNRECTFGGVDDGELRLNDAGRVVWSVWDELPPRFPGLELDAFVVMPNHVHGIIVIVGAGLALPCQKGAGYMGKGAASGAPTVEGAIRAFKSLPAVHVNRLTKRTGPLWQRNYYDHIIRDEDNLNSIRQYILDNPARWAEDENHPNRIGQAAIAANLKELGYGG
jgi:REP element-mobilizing transposase RayT